MDNNDCLMIWPLAWAWKQGVLSPGYMNDSRTPLQRCNREWHPPTLFFRMWSLSPVSMAFWAGYIPSTKLIFIILGEPAHPQTKEKLTSSSDEISLGSLEMKLSITHHTNLGHPYSCRFQSLSIARARSSCPLSSKVHCATIPKKKIRPSWTAIIKATKIVKNGTTH